MANKSNKRQVLQIGKEALLLHIFGIKVFWDKQYEKLLFQATGSTKGNITDNFNAVIRSVKEDVTLMSNKKKEIKKKIEEVENRKAKEKENGDKIST